MTTGEYMDQLERRGVRFDLADGAIVIDIPPGVLGDEDRAELVARGGAIAALVRLALEPATAPTQRVAPPLFGRAA